MIFGKYERPAAPSTGHANRGQAPPKADSEDEQGQQPPAEKPADNAQSGATAEETGPSATGESAGRRPRANTSAGRNPRRNR
jgi:hypothetical protein